MAFLHWFRDTSAETDVVVDLGCGPDGLGLYIPPARLKVGIDPLMDIYSRYYELHQKALLVKAVGEALPLRNGVATRVICVNVLDHVLDWRLVLNEIHRVLQPSGTALIHIYCQPVIDQEMMKVGYRPPLDEYHPTKIAAANIFCQLGMLHFKIDSRYSIPSGLFIQFLGRGQLHSREIEHVSLIARNPSKYLFPMIRLLDLILFPFSPKMFAGEAEFYCTKASDLSQSDSPASTPE